MNKKQIITAAVIAVVFAGGGFFGGMKYAQAKRTSQLQSFRNGATSGANAFAGRRGGAGPGAGGFANGQIISKDDKSITIKMMDGSSKIVFLADSTTVGKTVAGAVADLSTGNNVTVTGTANSDGTITAQSVQIRPDIPNRPSGQ